MARSQKEFELLFKLKAALGGNFNSTFKSAIDTNKKLQESVKGINSLQSKVDGYTKSSNAILKQTEKLEKLQIQHEKTAQKIQVHKDHIDALNAIIEKNGDETGALTAELSRETRELEQCNHRLKQEEVQIKQTSASIENHNQKMKELGEELEQAGISTKNLASENEKLQKSYDKLKSSQERLGSLNEKQKEIQAAISQTKLQLAGTIGVFGGIATAIYAGPVQAAKNYETAMAKVSTIADEKAVPLDEMSSEIMKLSNTTGLAASQIADDVYNAISAGQKTGDAVNFVSYSTKLAKAGFADSAQTLDVLTTILNAYGMEAEEVSKVSDMLVQTQNKGKVSVGQLSSVMGKIIPTANANNVALEQLCAGYAIMTSKGIAAAETTTYMNSMLNELSKSGTTADKTLRATAGQSFKELMASGKSLGEVVQMLEDAAQKSGKSLNDMFGSAEAGKAATSLLSGGVEGFNEQVQGMIDSVGATEEAFAKMDSTTESKMQKAKNSFANLSIVLGQTFLPIVGKVADKVAAVVVKISQFAQENPKLVQTALKAGTALAGMKLAGITAKLGFLEMKNGIVNVQKLFALFEGKTAILGAKSIGLGNKLKAVGGGVIGYFKNVTNALGGVGKAAGDMFKGNILFQKAGELFGSIKGSLSAGIAQMTGTLRGSLTKTGTKLLSFLLKPLSGISSFIKRSPLGTIGNMVASGFSKLGAVIASVGNVIKTVLGPLGKLGTTILGPLGGIAGKVLPIVGIITMIITAVELLRKNFDKVRETIGTVFGQKGLEIFDKIVAVIKSTGETIKTVFSDGNLSAARDKINEIFGKKGVAIFDTFSTVFQKVTHTAGDFVGFVTTHIVPAAERVFNLLISTIVPGIISGLQSAAPEIMKVFQAIADFIGAIIPIIGSFIVGIMPIIEEIIGFLQVSVFPVISEVFHYLVSTVLPAIVQGIQQMGTMMITILSAVLPVVQTVFQTIWSIIQPVLQQILAAVQAALPQVLSVFSTVFQTIGTIVQAAQQVFSGLIQFITGVFTGNWGAAWEGVKTVFQGVWDGLKGIATGAVNGIIGMINSAISGLNSIKIPDWVPGVGGKGINIPTIPTFAKGTKNTPDTFIAGEEGPELITHAPGMTIYTAQQTKDIMQAQNAAVKGAAIKGTVRTFPQEIYNNVKTPETKPLEVMNNAWQQGGNSIVINNNPTIYVDSDKAGDLEEKLQENNKSLLQDVKDLLDKRADDERRSRHE